MPIFGLKQRTHCVLIDVLSIALAKSESSGRRMLLLPVLRMLSMRIKQY